MKVVSLLPAHHSNTDAIELIIEASEESGYKAGTDVKISLDVVSTANFMRINLINLNQNLNVLPVMSS